MPDELPQELIDYCHNEEEQSDGEQMYGEDEQMYAEDDFNEGEIDNQLPIADIINEPLTQARINYLRDNPSSYFGSEDIVHYLSTILRLSESNAIAINPYYLSMSLENLNPNLNDFIINPLGNDNPAVMLFPVHFAQGRAGGHWALVIHDRRSGRTLFADSLSRAKQAMTLDLPSRSARRQSRAGMRSANCFLSGLVNSNDAMTAAGTG